MVGYRQSVQLNVSVPQLSHGNFTNGHANGECEGDSTDSDAANSELPLENGNIYGQTNANMYGDAIDGSHARAGDALPKWIENFEDGGSFDNDGIYTVPGKNPLLIDVEIPDASAFVATANEAEQYLGSDLYRNAVEGVADLIQLDTDHGEFERGTYLYGGSYMTNGSDAVPAANRNDRRHIKPITFNESLPIYKYKNEIIEKLDRNDVVFVHGDTGCGKSTQIPVYIFDHCVQNGRKCNILITQPRRIAATSVASYVASSHNWKLGGLVGYHVSIDRKTSTGGRSDGSATQHTCITYCTTGILLQKLIYRPDILQSYTHIIFDEVHERSADLDLAMMFTKYLVRPPNPDTKLIIMSATFEATKFWRYLSAPDDVTCIGHSNGDAHMNTTMPRGVAILDDVCVTIRSRQFKVDLVYLDQILGLKKHEEQRAAAAGDNLPMVNRWGNTAKWVSAMTCLQSDDSILYEPRVMLPVLQYAASIVIDVEISERKRMKAARAAGVRDESTGVPAYGKGILIFLPGIEDILTMKALLNQHRKQLLRECGSTLNIVTLHASAVSLAEQMHQFEYAPQRQRRVVLSTNVGESSITLPDIGYVIDLCLTKQLFWDSHSAWTSLDVVWASKCSAEQRAGRCGRTCDGFVYRLVPKVVYDGTVPDVDMPEVRRAPIHASILRAKAFADAAAQQGQSETSVSPQDILDMLIEPPSENIVLKSTMYLKRLGALTVLSPVDNQPSHTDGTLTALGDLCIKLPVDLFVSRFIMFGFACNLLSEALEIAAILASRDTVLMLHKFNSVDEDNKGSNCAGLRNAGEAVPTGVLIDLNGGASTNGEDADENSDIADEDAGDCSDDFLDMYSQYKRLLVWDNAQHSDTFAFRAAYRVWKRDIQPLPYRADCERACRRLALCHERLEQIYAVEMELRKRLRAMRFFRGDEKKQSVWEKSPNERAKLLVLKMLLAAAVTPHYFQIVSPDNQIPARHHAEYYRHGATLDRASQDLCHRPILKSVMVCLERDIISQPAQQNGEGMFESSTTNRDAEPISIFDADFIRIAFEEMCCRLPIDMKVHFIIPSIDSTPTAPVRVMEFVVEFSRLAHEQSAATGDGRGDAEIDGEASLALQMLLHRIRMMSRACSREKGDTSGSGNGTNNYAYRSVHENASGLPTLFLPDVRHLQIQKVSTIAVAYGSESSLPNAKSMDEIIYDARLPLLRKVKKNYFDLFDTDDSGLGKVFEVLSTDTHRAIGAPRPTAYNVKQLFKLHEQEFVQKHKVAEKLANMPSDKCAVIITRQQQANAENVKLIEQNSRAPTMNGTECFEDEYDDNFIKPVLPVKIFYLHACDQASIILNIGLAEAHRELYATYEKAAEKIKLLANWLDEISACGDSTCPAAAKANRFDAVQEFVIGKCFLYRVMPFPVDEMDRSLSYTLRLIYSFFKAMQLDEPKYLRVQVLALQSATTVLVEFIDFAISEVVPFDKLAYLPAGETLPSISDQVDADYEAIWCSVPQLAERVRLGPAKCTMSVHGTDPEYVSAMRILTVGSVCDWLDSAINNVWVTFLQYLDGVYEVDVLFNVALFGAIRDGVVAGRLAIRDDPVVGNRAAELKNCTPPNCVDLAQCQEIGAKYFSSEWYKAGLRSFKFMSLSVALQGWKSNGRFHPLAVDATPLSLNGLAATDMDYFNEEVSEQMAFANQAPLSQRIALPARTVAPEMYVPATDTDLMEQYDPCRFLNAESRVNGVANAVQSQQIPSLEVALKWRRISLSVYSPLLIPNTYVHNLQLDLLQKPVAVSFNSVNAVLLSNAAALSNVEHAGRRTEQRMLIATDVSASRSRKTISLRHTTLMPALPGMLPLCAMLFSPCVDFRMKQIWKSDGKTEKFVGYEPIAALCGVGSEFALQRPDTRAAIQSMDPAHDILVPFDVQFMKGDFLAINRFRREMSCVIALPLRYARRSETAVREKLFYRLLQLAMIIGTNRPPAAEVDWDSVYNQVFSEADGGASAFAWHGLPTRYGGEWQEAQVSNQVMILEAMHNQEYSECLVDFDVPQRSLVFNATSRSTQWPRPQNGTVINWPHRNPEQNGNHVNGVRDHQNGFGNNVDNCDERFSEDSSQHARNWNVRRMEAILPEFSVQPL